MRKYRIILLIVLIKLCSVLYLVHLSKCNNPETFIGIASYAGDASSYIAPIDNFINDGSYYFETARAGRMPYLGLVYLPFRLLFSKETALSIVVILQIIMESIAIYYMAKLCENIFKTVTAFWLFIFLSCISLYVTFYDYAIMTESFGISFLCLFLYQYYNFLSNGRKVPHLISSGLFLSLSFLFKPYFFPIYLLICAEFLWYDYHTLKKIFIGKICKYSFIISFPFIIINVPWTIRNYIIFNRIIPFQQDVYAGFKYSAADGACMAFIKTIGESYMYWDKRSAGSYFQYNSRYPCEYKFPERIFGQNLTMNDIDDARHTYFEYQKKPCDSLEKLAALKFNKLSETYKSEHRMFYYIGSPFILCEHFLFNSGSYYLPIEKNSPCYHSYQWLIKLSQSFLYYLCLFFGFAGISILLFKKPKSYMLIAIPLYLICLFPIYFRGPEFRYFSPAYPCLLVGLTYVIIVIIKRLIRN